MSGWGDEIVVKKNTEHHETEKQEPVVHKPQVFEISEEELQDLSSAANKLWDMDTDCLQPYTDYEIDLQSGKKAYQHDDKCKRPFFKFVHESVFKKPVYKKFFALLDNYEPDTGVDEVVTKTEKLENWAFLDEVMQKPTMQYVHQYLAQKGKTSSDITQFKKHLYQIWFELYSRSGKKKDSSGFEHVFVGEVKKGQVIGFHNWINFYVQEQKGQVDYKGWIKAKKKGYSHDADPDGNEALVTVQFDWEGQEKMVSSTFIGTSPHFEMALYTLCFLCGEEDNFIDVGGYNVNIKCYKINTHQGVRIGTSYPMSV